jgi:hypothetical protein
MTFVTEVEYVYCTVWTESSKMIDLVLRHSNFYEKRETEMEFAVTLSHQFMK